MITLAIDPVLAHIGPFSIRWYGLTIAVAVAVAIFVGQREAGRQGVSEDEVYSLSMWSVLAGVVGARLFHVIDQWEYYRGDLRSIIAFQQGGLAIYGGLVAGLIAGIACCRWRRLPVGRMVDVAAPALVLGQAVGRLGCIINGDAWGSPTLLPWGVVYTDPGALIPSPLLGVPTHPTPIYEIIWNLGVFAALWNLRSRRLRDGTLFLVYLVSYSIGRFLITFLRREEIIFAGLQQAQLVAALLVVTGAILLYWMRRRGPISSNPMS